MQILNSILTWVMKKRVHQIELFKKYPHEVQDEVLKKLLTTARYTEFGQKYAFDELVDYEDYKRRVPIHTYEQLFPYINRLMRGEQNVLWPSDVKWFAKSSGTPMHAASLFRLQPKPWMNVTSREAKTCCRFM